MESIQHKTVQANGLSIHIAEKGEGPLVLFLHGFPELWYSWRHQILYLADHGYRAVAPDLRGYGDTTGAPVNDPTKFTIHHLVGDLIGLLDAITNEDDEKVFVVGHDWGAIIAWHLCMFRPDRVKALVNLSVSFIPWNPNGDLVEMLRAAYGEDHYMTRFQEPGKAEAEFGKMSTQTFVKKILTIRDPTQIYISKDKDQYLAGDTPVTLPPWLTEEDIEYFASQLDKTGFSGGLNYYRAFHLSWELSAAWRGGSVMVPTKFMIGDLDLTYHMPGMKDYIERGGFRKDVPLLEEVVVMEGAAHFINQEKPHEINNHIFQFLQKF